MNEAASSNDDFYFAYGSNLNLGELKAACAEAGLGDAAIEPVAAAWLPDMSLVFDYYSTSRGGGALNVRPVKGSLVSGYLLRLSPDAWRLVDRKEGHPAYYRRSPVTVLVKGGAYVSATTYIVSPERTQGFVPRRRTILPSVRMGAGNWEWKPAHCAARVKGKGLPFSIACFATEP